MPRILKAALAAVAAVTLAPTALAISIQAPPSRPPPLSEEAREAVDAVRARLTESGRDAARAFLDEVVAILHAPAPGAERTHVRFLIELRNLAEELGSLALRRRLCERIVDVRASFLPDGDPDLLSAKGTLASACADVGDNHQAQLLYEEVLSTGERTLPPTNRTLVFTKMNLAGLHQHLADHDRAKKLYDELREPWKALFSPDDPMLYVLPFNKSELLRALGDLDGARNSCEEAIAGWTRTLPPEDTRLFNAKLELAATLRQQGEPKTALQLVEEVVAGWSRVAPPEHVDLIMAKFSLAQTRKMVGDLPGARVLMESVLTALTAVLPRDHAYAVAARGSLAMIELSLGDLQSARALQESALRANARTYPPDHPKVLGAKLNLAAIRKGLGDLAGAREIEEELLITGTRVFRADHPSLLRIKGNLGATRIDLGDLDGALALHEEVLAGWSRQLPPDHPELIAAMTNVAVASRMLGNYDVSLGLEEDVLASVSRVLPPRHPQRLKAMTNLALTRKALGNLAGARELEEELLLTQARHLQPGSPELLGAIQNLAWTRDALGDDDGTRELLSRLLAGLRARARALRTESPRVAREGARIALRQLSDIIALSHTRAEDPVFDAALFAALESTRLASITGPETARAIAAHPELRALVNVSAEARRRLNDLAVTRPSDRAAVEAWRKGLVNFAEERDLADRRLRAALDELGAITDDIDADAVATKLAPGAAVVSFLRTPLPLDGAINSRGSLRSVDSMLAFVVRADAPVQRLEIGSSAEIESLIYDWRRGLGRPVERGEAVETPTEDFERRAGRALRARILDPVLAAAGEDVDTLHVILDDALYLVPLDALPLESGGRLGESVSLFVSPSLSSLLETRHRPVPGETLVAVGGIDYDAEQTAGNEARTASRPTPGTRAGLPASFAPLRQTQYEVDDIAAQFEETFGEAPVLLTRSEGTKSRISDAVSRARYFHLATHGWFAGEVFKSQLDDPGDGAYHGFRRATETVTGFAPSTLCGLALAGANRAAGPARHGPGLLTAEELAGFDLHRCELAVLSACETNVGIRRAGQGIQSLQCALHAAGARTTITSLWKVDDAATRRLFELFYTAHWRDGRGKHVALRVAKSSLRKEGHPPRDWAAWVLTGDPN